MTLDEQNAILSQTAHRPYPLPAGPWVMRQRWNDLLFAHWPVPAAMVAPHLPAGLEVDTFDGNAWLGVIPFWMDQVQQRPRVLGVSATVSVPGVRRFPELNLRTYVRSRRTGKPGIFFFTLECGSLLAVLGARVLFHLPYAWASMEHRESAAGIAYHSRRLLSRQSVAVDLTYRAIGPVAAPSVAGTLAYFLTERYCLYTLGFGRLLGGEVHHEPWPLQPAEAEWRTNELPAAYGLTLPEVAPVLQFSRSLPVFLWPLRAE
jgi:uncharacterized protein YqjF (DUF2071 family)